MIPLRNFTVWLQRRGFLRIRGQSEELRSSGMQLSRRLLTVTWHEKSRWSRVSFSRAQNRHRGDAIFPMRYRRRLNGPWAVKIKISTRDVEKCSVNGVIKRIISNLFGFTKQATLAGCVASRTQLPSPGLQSNITEQE